MSAPSITLGARLRASREAAGLSYRDARAATGLALGHLQRLERGEVRSPTPATLRRMADAYGVSHVELMRLAGHL